MDNLSSIMAKTETIIVRVDPELKARIDAAAHRLGKSVTSFMLEAAAAAVRKVDKMPTTTTTPTGRGACPTWFVARCREATQGGAGGYAAVGYSLAGGIGSMQPWELDEDEWEAALTELEELLRGPGRHGKVAYRRPKPDDAAVWAWFEKYMPRCTALIPRRRRDLFLAGIYQAVEDESINLVV